MARDGLDTKELQAYSALMMSAGKQMENEEKKFLRSQGNALAKKTRKLARAKVAKVAVNRKDHQRFAGQYHKSIKRGKVYKVNDTVRIRVYTSDFIGHLIEQGWTPKARNKRKGNRVRGKYVFNTARNEQQPEFEKALAKFVDEQLDKFAKEGRA